MHQACQKAVKQNAHGVLGVNRLTISFLGSDHKAFNILEGYRQSSSKNLSVSYDVGIVQLGPTDNESICITNDCKGY